MKMMLTMITATIIPGGFLILAVVALVHILRHSSGGLHAKPIFDLDAARIPQIHTRRSGEVNQRTRLFGAKEDKLKAFVFIKRN